MQIIELDSIEPITQIHEQVFGTPFPYESYLCHTNSMHMPIMKTKCL